jgi:hypothetical protein
MSRQPIGLRPWPPAVPCPRLRRNDYFSGEVEANYCWWDTVVVIAGLPVLSPILI